MNSGLRYKQHCPGFTLLELLIVLVISGILLGAVTLNFTLGERETAELEVIDAALHRIDMGTYGDCADCGEPIGLARLNASPDVPRCMDCQTQREHHRLG